MFVEEIEQVEEVEDFQALYESSLRALDDGVILPGAVVATLRDGFLVDVDVGGKSEALLNLKEISLAVKDVKVGDVRDVVVYGTDDDEVVRVSERRARAQKTWTAVMEAHATGGILEATVLQVVKGGVLVDLGMRGFVPASQLGVGAIGALEDYIGRALRCKVLELDEKRNRVVLSARAVIQEERQINRDALLGSLEVGQVRQGVVVRLADFGAFVDLGGIDGLAHNSELSYAHIKHPSEVVKVGETLDVEVIRVDHATGRVSLSLKHALLDPWVEHATSMIVGESTRATVVKIMPNYILVEVFPGVLAMSNRGNYSEFIDYEVGLHVEVTYLSINSLTRRIAVEVGNVVRLRSTVEAA